MPILAPFYTQGGWFYPFYSQSTKGVGSWDARGLVPGMQGDSFANELGGIMEVAMWFCAPLLVGL
jgi:hypothetical protein